MACGTRLCRGDPEARLRGVYFVDFSLRKNAQGERKTETLTFVLSKAEDREARQSRVGPSGRGQSERALAKQSHGQ